MMYRKLLILLVGVAVVGVGAGIANAGTDADRVVETPSGRAYGTASEVFGDNAVNSPMSEADLKRLMEVIPESRPSNLLPGDDVGPIRSEVVPSDGKVLLNSKEYGRLSAVPTSRGDVCYLYTRADGNWVANCVQWLDAAGTKTIEWQDPRTGEYIVTGIAADRIDALTISTARAAATPAVLANNAFVWRSPARNGRPAQVHARVAGEVSTTEFN